MRKKLFKYGCFIPFSTICAWKKITFKSEEEVFKFIIQENKSSIPLHCAICYFYRKNINHDDIYVLKYKHGIYEVR